MCFSFALTIYFVVVAVGSVVVVVAFVIAVILFAFISKQSALKYAFIAFLLCLLL